LLPILAVTDLTYGKACYGVVDSNLLSLIET
jgi:hypothetical protein